MRILKYERTFGVEASYLIVASLFLTVISLITVFFPFLQRKCLRLSNSCIAVSDASSPFEAELAALSIASRPGDKNGNFVMDPSAMELIQKHSRQQCGRLGKKLTFAGVTFKFIIFERIYNHN